MAGVMYGATGNGSLIELRETIFSEEVHLQNFLSAHPALLAGDQMNPADPRQFVLITAEAGIAIKEAGGDYFSLDHLFVDQDGVPTLVEVKRSTDTRIRREVIGQMLEYAANFCAFWNGEKVREVFERRCDKLGIPHETALHPLLTPGAGVESIWEKVESNIRQERLRLVFLSDKFSPETQRIIEFLNRQMGNSEAYAVEVPQFTDAAGTMKALVPRVLNPSVIEAQRKKPFGERGDVWTSARFFDAVAERQGAAAVDVFRNIVTWAEKQASLAILFGRGKTDGSIWITFKAKPDGRGYRSGDVVILSLWSFGRIEIDFQYLMTHEPFDDEKKRIELRHRLVENAKLAIPEGKISKRPSVDWRALESPRSQEALFDTIDWVVAELEFLWA